MDNFKRELASLLNRFSMENGSNTPDFVLAEFLNDCLRTFDATVQARGQALDWPLDVKQTYVQSMIKHGSKALHLRDSWYQPEADH